MFQEFEIQTPAEGFINITGQILRLVSLSNVKNGLCQIFVPHTTAGITINENADPDVVKDMLKALDNIVPKLTYQHAEGNSRAHVKATMVGSSVTVPIADSAVRLGTWQGIYLCEFDGPRHRNVFVTCIGM